MLKSTKDKLQKTREFAHQHQTLIACTATGVVSIVVTRRLDARIAREFAYAAGLMHGVLAVRNDLLQTFIESKGLKEEFLTEFIPSLS